MSSLTVDKVTAIRSTDELYAHDVKCTKKERKLQEQFLELKANLIENLHNERNQLITYLENKLDERERYVQVIKEEREYWSYHYKKNYRQQYMYEEVESKIRKRIEDLDTSIFPNMDISKFEEQLKKDKVWIGQKIKEVNDQYERENNERVEQQRKSIQATEETISHIQEKIYEEKDAIHKIKIEQKQKLQQLKERQEQLVEHIEEMERQIGQFKAERQQLIDDFESKKKDETFESSITLLDESDSEKIHSELDIIKQFVPEQEIHRQIAQQYEDSKNDSNIDVPHRWASDFEPKFTTRELLEQLNVLRHLPKENDTVRSTGRILSTMWHYIKMFFSILWTIIKYPYKVISPIWRVVYMGVISIFGLLFIARALDFLIEVSFGIFEFIGLLFSILITLVIIAASVLFGHWIYVQFYIKNRVLEVYKENLPYYSLIQREKFYLEEELRFLEKQAMYNQKIEESCEEALQNQFSESRYKDLHKKRKEIMKEQQRLKDVSEKLRELQKESSSLYLEDLNKRLANEKEVLEQIRTTEVALIPYVTFNTFYEAAVDGESLPSYQWLQRYSEQENQRWIEEIESLQKSIQAVEGFIAESSSSVINASIHKIARWVSDIEERILKIYTSYETSKKALEEKEKLDCRPVRQAIEKKKQEILERGKPLTYLELERAMPETVLVDNPEITYWHINRQPQLILYETSPGSLKQSLYDLIISRVRAIDRQSAQSLTEQYIFSEFVSDRFKSIKDIQQLQVEQDVTRLEQFAQKEQKRSLQLGEQFALRAKGNEGYTLEDYIEEYLQEEDLESLIEEDRQYIYSQLQAKYKFIHIVWPTEQLSTTMQKIQNFAQHWNVLMTEGGEKGIIPILYINREEFEAFSSEEIMSERDMDQDLYAIYKEQINRNIMQVHRVVLKD